MIGAGAFVAFGDGHEGMLPVRRLRGDWWELNEEGTMLRRRAAGEALRLGDPVRVQVERVDAPRGRVDLSPVSSAATRPEPWPPRSARPQPGDVATNRQASYRYHLLDRWEAGIVLQGTEVKSLRDGKAQIKDGYAAIRDGEVWLYNVHIPPYAAGRAREPRARAPAQAADAPARDRAPDRQDAARRASRSSRRASTSRAATPRSRSRSRKGKDVGDKRRAIKERELKREMERATRR